MPRSFDGAHRRLHRGGRLQAVAAAHPIVVASTLVAGAAQELIDLGLDGRLHHQPHRQPGDVLEGRGQVTVRREQRVDLGADALDGRYSFRHACRSLFVSRQLFEGTYAGRHLHQRRDATAG